MLHQLDLIYGKTIRKVILIYLAFLLLETGGLHPVKSKNLNYFLKKNKDLQKKNLLLTSKFFKKNKKCQVFDIIYDPIQTILIKVANKSTKKNLNGLEMNLEQAVLAYSIVNKFTNIDLIKKIMKKK